MKEWIDCDVSLPPQKNEGAGRCSEMVVVELSDGTIAQDWLINDKWTIHCKKNGSATSALFRTGAKNV